MEEAVAKEAPAEEKPADALALVVGSPRLFSAYRRKQLRRNHHFGRHHQKGRPHN
jgi:hypothetical protein